MSIFIAAQSLISVHSLKRAKDYFYEAVGVSLYYIKKDITKCHANTYIPMHINYLSVKV